MAPAMPAKDHGAGPGSGSGRPRANWLLRTLVLVSVAVHSVLFLHISGLYRSEGLTAIELTLKEPERPRTRNIPKPRLRPKPPPPSRIHVAKAVRRPVPDLRAMPLAPMDPAAPASLVETIAQPRVSEIAAPSLAAWQGDALADPGHFGTARDYFDMVRLRIESKKKYPAKARVRQIEGRVTVRFTIGLDGNVREAAIAKSAGFTMLDRAALKAVNRASPFPRPPGNLFDGDIPLEITIVFELT